MAPSAPDVIDGLAGIEPGSALDGIRAHRPQARDNAQASFAALFEPAEPGAVTLVERRALALFVTGLHGAMTESAFYATLLDAAAPPPGLLQAIGDASQGGEGEGPGGRYPAGPLQGESSDVPGYAVPAELRARLGERLSAAFEHAHMLVFRPREADAAALQRLLDAGWTTTGIVTLSQIVAFLAFQIRVAAGLRLLAAHPAA